MGSSGAPCPAPRAWLQHFGECWDGWNPFDCRAGCGGVVDGKGFKRLAWGEKILKWDLDKTLRDIMSGIAGEVFLLS